MYTQGVMSVGMSKGVCPKMDVQVNVYPTGYFRRYVQGCMSKGESPRECIPKGLILEVCPSVYAQGGCPIMYTQGVKSGGMSKGVCLTVDVHWNVYPTCYVSWYVNCVCQRGKVQGNVYPWG